MHSITITDLFDPRGRADRRGLATLAVILVAAQLAFLGIAKTAGVFDPAGPAACILNTIFLWIGVTAVSKRLHDVGLSAAWLLWSLLATFVWMAVVSFAVIAMTGEAAVTPDSPSFLLAFIVSMAPLMVAACWLHAAKGEPNTNQYGPVTDASGFSRMGSGSHAETAA